MGQINIEQIIMQCGQCFYNDSNCGNSGPGQLGTFWGAGEGITGGDIRSGLQAKFKFGIRSAGERNAKQRVADGTSRRPDDVLETESLM